MSKAGNFEIDVWKGGYPVWCHLKYEGKDVKISLSHNELSDLHYVVTKAMQEQD